jgi:hypothetical protein
VTHARCIDTAILFPHPRGFPLRLKLKELAETHLNIIIQRNQANFTPNIKNEIISENENKNEIETENGNDKSVVKDNAVENTVLKSSTVLKSIGHDSVEDAATAMRLVLLKLEKGPDFGSKIPPSGRIPLSRFFLGTGISENDPQPQGVVVTSGDGEDRRNSDTNDVDDHGDNGNSKNNNNENINNGNDNNNSNNSNGKNENKNIFDKNTSGPVVSFFWENPIECRTMGSCLSGNNIFNPCGELDDIMGKVRGVISGSEGQGEGEGVRGVKEKLRSQLFCYIGISCSEKCDTSSSDNRKNIDEKNNILKNNNSDNNDDRNKNNNINNNNKNNKSNDKSSRLNAIIEILKSSLQHTQQGSVIIITAQKPLNLVTNLLKQKKACENPQSVSRWTQTLDSQLRDAYACCNMASMITITV